MEGLFHPLPHTILSRDWLNLLFFSPTTDKFLNLFLMTDYQILHLFFFVTDWQILLFHLATDWQNNSQCFSSAHLNNFTIFFQDRYKILIFFFPSNHSTNFSVFLLMSDPQMSWFYFFSATNRQISHIPAPIDEFHYFFPPWLIVEFTIFFLQPFDVFHDEINWKGAYKKVKTIGHIK